MRSGCSVSVPLLRSRMLWMRPSNATKPPPICARVFTSIGLRYEVNATRPSTCSATQRPALPPWIATRPPVTFRVAAISTIGRKKVPFFSFSFRAFGSAGGGGGARSRSSSGALSVTSPRSSTPIGNRRSNPRSNATRLADIAIPCCGSLNENASRTGARNQPSDQRSNDTRAGSAALLIEASTHRRPPSIESNVGISATRTTNGTSRNRIN